MSARFRSAVWTNRPIWPKDWPSAPEREDPEGLDWDLWLGPAPKVPYSSKCVPFKWRGWWDYGTGALGDMACHIMDMPYWALDLRYPLSVEAEQGGNSDVSGPEWSVIKYQFPARGSNPPLAMTWYDGRRNGQANMPPRDVAEGEDLRGYESVLVGDKGAMVFNRRSTKWKIVGRDADEVKQIELSTPQSVARVQQDGISTQDANLVEWISGIKGKGTPLSIFASCWSVYRFRLVGQLGRADRAKDRLGRSVNETERERGREVRPQKVSRGLVLVSFLMEVKPRTGFP